MKGETKFGIGVAMLVIAAMAVILITGSVKPVAAAYNSVNESWDESTVTVQIGAKTMIDVTPELIDFGLTYPGEIVKEYRPNSTFGQQNISAFQIENIGSTNISKIWLNVTRPKVNPFGTGVPSNYNPGNWIAVDINFTVGNSTYLATMSDINMSYIHRVEFNTSQPIVYLKKPPGTTAYGRFRVGSNEYFWAIVGNCTADPWILFYMGNNSEPHNQNQTGDIDLTDGDEIYINLTRTTGKDGNTWFVPASSSDVLKFKNVEGYLEQYLVIVNGSCNAVHFVGWDRDFADMTGANVAYLPSDTAVFDEALAGQPLYPGEDLAMNIELRVPYGVPASTYTGYMTVVASRI